MKSYVKVIIFGLVIGTWILTILISLFKKSTVTYSVQVDLPEEISQVSSDSLKSTQLSAFKRNDTVFIYFTPK